MIKNYGMIELMAKAVEEKGATKGEIAAPLTALLSVLNDQYLEGGREAHSRKEVLADVDEDLFIVNLAVQGIFIRAWMESKSFEEMQAKMATLLRELKTDIERQRDEAIAKHEKAELKA